MILDHMLTILVSDWRNREQCSDESMPLAEVVRLLGSEQWQEIRDTTATAEIVDLIHNYLADHDCLREATKTAHQFDSSVELLREMTLMGVVQDWRSAIVGGPHETGQIPSNGGTAAGANG